MEATSGVERRIEFINTEMYALRRPLSPHVGGRVRHLRASYPHRPSTVCAPHLQKEDGIAPEGEGEGLRDFADKCAHGVSLVSMPACGCVAAAVALCAPLDPTGHKDAARSEQNQGRRLGRLLPLRSAGVQKRGGKSELRRNLRSHLRAKPSGRSFSGAWHHVVECHRLHVAMATSFKSFLKSSSGERERPGIGLRLQVHSLACMQASKSAMHSTSRPSSARIISGHFSGAMALL